MSYTDGSSLDLARLMGRVAWAGRRKVRPAFRRQRLPWRNAALWAATAPENEACTARTPLGTCRVACAGDSLNCGEAVAACAVLA